MPNHPLNGLENRVPDCSPDDLTGNSPDSLGDGIGEILDRRVMIDE